MIHFRGNALTHMPFLLLIDWSQFYDFFIETTKIIIVIGTYHIIPLPLSLSFSLSRSFSLSFSISIS